LRSYIRQICQTQLSFHDEGGIAGHDRIAERVATTCTEEPSDVNIAERLKRASFVGGVGPRSAGRDSRLDQQRALTSRSNAPEPERHTSVSAAATKLSEKSPHSWQQAQHLSVLSTVLCFSFEVQSMVSDCFPRMAVIGRTFPQFAPKPSAFLTEGRGPKYKGRLELRYLLAAIGRERPRIGAFCAKK
jgi:hypothetical protein